MAGYLFFTLSICRDETKEKKEMIQWHFCYFFLVFFTLNTKLKRSNVYNFADIIFIQDLILVKFIVLYFHFDNSINQFRFTTTIFKLLTYVL